MVDPKGPTRAAQCHSARAGRWAQSCSCLDHESQQNRPPGHTWEAKEWGAEGERNTGQGEKVRMTTGHTFGHARLGQARVMFWGVGSWQLGGIKCLGNLAGRCHRHGLIDMHVKRHGSQTKRTAKGNETSDIPRRDSHRKNERAARSSFQTHWRRGEAKGEDI